MRSQFITPRTLTCTCTIMTIVANIAFHQGHLQCTMYLSDGLLAAGVQESDGPVCGSHSHNLGCLDVLQRPSCRHLTNRLTDHTDSCRARGGINTRTL